MEIIPIAFGYLQGIMAGVTNNLLIFPFPLFGSRIHFMTRQNIDMTFSLLRNLMVGLKNTLYSQCKCVVRIQDTNLSQICTAIDGIISDGFLP